MRFDQDSDRTIIPKHKRFSTIALLAAILGGVAALAQPALEAENEAVIEAGRGKDVIIRSSNKPFIAGPAGVIVAAPDEEVFSDTAPAISDAPDAPDAPKAPDAPRAARPKRKIQNQNEDESVQRRLMELERKIDNLAERDRIRLKNSPFEFNQKEF